MSGVTSGRLKKKLVPSTATQTLANHYRTTSISTSNVILFQNNCKVLNKKNFNIIAINKYTP